MTLEAAEPHTDVPQCPVPHAKDTPLPPGHPEIPVAPPSKLQNPSGEHCIFFRQPEDGQNLSSMEVTTESLTPDPVELQDPEHLLVLSSRKSALAVCQATEVQLMLEARYGGNSPAFAPHAAEAADTNEEIAGVHRLLRGFEEDRTKELVPYHFPVRTMATLGDNNQRSPLYVIGGEGRAIWTKELEVALVAGSVDAIVHSLKDVPTTLPDGLELAAILEREDPRDALVVKQGLPYKSINDLPRGSVVGTSSVRRVALLRRAFPHLMFSDVRGNIQTRLAKLDAKDGPYTAIVLAAAGLKRMNLEDRITSYLVGTDMQYAVGQGALGVEVRTPRGPNQERDEKVRTLIRSISNWRSTWRCVAERALMHRMEGGCSIPLGVTTRLEDHDELEGKMHERIETPMELAQSGVLPTRVPIPPMPPAEGCRLTLSAVIVSLDGKQSCQHTETMLCRSAEDAERLGILVAEELEHNQNARGILDEVEHHRRLAEVADEKRRAAQNAGEATLAVPEVDRRGMPRDDGEPKAWEV
ncbi:porphobilinogen deaminase [Malassezia pachydermatis]|uniref:hydroxymethylbilane synthase n=1 Tax=Malassezia pachydermatis TaxID=77020 RepID=A0A0M9VNG1_9BASI|nr:porphobilinogen deaminase [Malassezia pachydermatis]KOS13292.1 porphobilinogen deaminase [Malassezia pachydermatis]